MVQSTFSLPWMPAVAIGWLPLSLEQLGTPVLMQQLELMCDCAETCWKAQDSLYHEDVAWEPSHLWELQTWILPALYLLLLTNPPCGPLPVSQCSETSQMAKTWECQWLENQRQIVPFHLCPRNEGLVSLEMGQFSSPLCCSWHFCVVWRSLTESCRWPTSLVSYRSFQLDSLLHQEQGSCLQGLL